MAKKIAISFSVVFCVVLTGLTFFLIAAEYSTDTAALLEQAQAYVEDRYYEQAEAIYKSVMTDYPGSDFALEAQIRLTQLYIFWEKEPEAEAAFEAVLAEFSQEENTPEVVIQVADIYRGQGKHQEALELYQYCLNRWPDSEQAIRLQLGMAISNIALGNDSDAQVAIEKLLAEFSDNEEYIAEAVADIAERYRKSGRYEEAVQFYQYALANWPGSEESMWSQAGLAWSTIALGDDPNAQAAIDKLLTEFSDNNGIAEAVYDIADEYFWLEKYEKANQLFQYVLDNRPRAEEAMFSHARIAMSNISLGNDTVAQASIHKLLTEFSEHPDRAQAVYDVADHYRELEQYEKAQELFQYVVDNWPQSKGVVWSQAGLAASNIALGDDPNAQAAIDSLIADLNGHLDLPDDAISNIEAEYYKKILVAKPPLREDYLNAVEVWEKVMEKFPDFLYNDPDLYYFVADCYRQLGEYEKAIEYYSIVAANWTQNGYAVLSNAVVPRAEDDDVAGDYEALHETIDRLIADFGDHPGLACVVTRSGHGYRRRANDAQREGLSTEAEADNLKAIALYGRVINEFGSSAFVASSYFFSALCYRDLDQWQDALDCCNQLLDSWPEYKYASWARRLAQDCSERLAAQVQ